MGLEEIEEHIKREEKSKIVKISTEAKRKYYEILTESARKAEEINAASDQKIRDEVSELIDSEINSARVEAERRYNLAYSNKLESNVRKIHDALQDFVKTEAYNSFLFEIINRITKSLGEDSEISVNPRDLKMAKEKFPNLRIIASKAKFIGGAKAVSPDGMTGIDLSLEDVMRRKREEIISRISGYIAE